MSVKALAGKFSRISFEKMNVQRSTLNVQHSIQDYSVFALPPLLHLLGERTMHAIRIVLQAKVFVDLQQTLLVRDRFQEMRAARVVPEKTRGASHQPPIGETRRQFLNIRSKTSRPSERAKG